MRGKRHEVTGETRAEVAALYSFGVPQPEIAAYIGCDPKTLRKYYVDELTKSKTKADASVAKFLYQAASGQALKAGTATPGATYADCVRAAMFWAKTRMNWRETENHNHVSEDGSMSTKDVSSTAASKLANKLTD